MSVEFGITRILSSFTNTNGGWSAVKSQFVRVAKQQWADSDYRLESDIVCWWEMLGLDIDFTSLNE